MNKFWMLYVPGKGNPTVTHDSYFKAYEEARRLIRDCNAKKVVILQAFELIEPVEIPVPLSVTVLK